MTDADERLARVLPSARLRPVDEPVELPSASNNAWSINDERQGAVVLRICYRGDTDRLLREGAVGQRLPAAVGYPTLLAFGRLSGDDDLTWSVTRRLVGVALSEAWPSLDGPAQRRACRQVGQMIRALHRWRPPPELIPVLVPSEPDPAAGMGGIVGRSMIPLPIFHARNLVTHAEALPGLDRQLLAEVRRYLGSLADRLVPTFDDPSSGVIHSDLHLTNVLWDDRCGAALLDLEWVRLAPAYVELARLEDNVDADLLEGAGGHPALYEWLRIDYPDLFSVPQLRMRIRLIRIVHQLRQLVISPPRMGAEELPRDHPERMLTQLLAG